MATSAGNETGARISMAKRLRRTERRHRDAIGGDAVGGGDLAARELGVCQDVSSGASAAPVKSPP